MKNYFKYRISCPISSAWRYKSYAVIKNAVLNDSELFLVDKETDNFLVNTTKPELIKILTEDKDSSPWVTTMIDIHDSLSSLDGSMIDILSNNLEKITYIRMMM